MLYSDVGLLADRQFLLDIGIDGGDGDGRRIVLCERPERLPEGRRVYREEGDFFRLIVFEDDAYIMCDPKISAWVQEYFGERSPEFMLSFHNLRKLDEKLGEFGYRVDEVQECFLPSWEFFEDVVDDGVLGKIERLGEDELQSLCAAKTFPHALVSYEKELRALAVKVNGRAIAVCGAQRDGKYLWQIGVDVLEEYRDQGLATALVRRLAEELIAEDKLPFYGVRPGNIISKRVALSAGFVPAFSEVYVAEREASLQFSGLVDR